MESPQISSRPYGGANQCMKTGYQTVTSASMFNKRSSTLAPSHNHPSIEESNQCPQISQNLYPLQMSMPRTRNKYRPKSSRPTECDDMLFGKPMATDYKEWKAPWDHSKSKPMLVYDSTDRLGHFAPERTMHASTGNTRRSYSANTKPRQQPWK